MVYILPTGERKKQLQQYFQQFNQIPRGKPSRSTLDFLVTLESGVLIGIIFCFSPQGAENKTLMD